CAGSTSSTGRSSSGRRASATCARVTSPRSRSAIPKPRP
ncbi:MAG: hypothetical protein AVDCRST_MAG79-2032, partial [uncultured Thermoleophilia bacterium]